MFATFVKGLAIGLAVAAPAGPITLLCIRRILSHGRAAGIASGLGVALADASYAAVAAFGLALVTEFLIAQSQWFALGGGLFLIWLGIATFRAAPPEAAQQTGSADLAAAFGSTFLLTLANPMTILSFVAIFGGLGLALRTADHLGAAILVAGVFAGSMLWWLIVTGGVGLLRGYATGAVLRWINRIAGLALAGFGVLALARGLT